MKKNTIIPILPPGAGKHGAILTKTGWCKKWYFLRLQLAEDGSEAGFDLLDETGRGLAGISMTPESMDKIARTWAVIWEEETDAKL